ncbi:MAG: hypothetical protein IPK80_14155 [Nannocystis sp.]|jgi:hypothetical protein|nr:hypothetical protein [Nannocystis sp.]
MPDLTKLVSSIQRAKSTADAKKLRFTGLSEAQLNARLNAPALRSLGAAPPMIVWQSWSSITTPGGSISYNVGIHNPAGEQVWLFAHVFVGPANFVADPGAAVQAVDARFPRLTEPAFDGLRIPAGGDASLSFQVDVPANVQQSNYLGNTFLFRADWHDVGVYLDRGVFIFGVGAV